MTYCCPLCDLEITKDRPYCSNMYCTVGYYNCLSMNCLSMPDAPDMEDVDNPLDKREALNRKQGSYFGVDAASQWLLERAAYSFTKNQDDTARTLREAATLMRDSKKDILADSNEG